MFVCFQFKFGVDGESESFVLQVTWPSTYPELCAPVFSLDLFYNKHLLAPVRAQILERVKAEATSLIGCASTFNVVEYVKEHMAELLIAQTQQHSSSIQHEDDEDAIDDANIQQQQQNSQVTAASTSTQQQQQQQAQMSKQQKRRMWDRGGAADARERGWDWVDIVKHLSQTGGAAQTS